MKDINLNEVVYFLMERVMRCAREQTKVQFKEHQADITVDQWILLKRISEDDGVSQIDIANTTFKDPAAVTRIIDILSRKELVERRAKPDDRRAYLIFLTPKGEGLVKRLTPVVKDLRALGLNSLSEDQINCLKQYLNQMYHNLQ